MTSGKVQKSEVEKKGIANKISTNFSISKKNRLLFPKRLADKEEITWFM
jgi:hypothetical protein